MFYCVSLRVPHCPAARAGPLTTHTTHLQRRTSPRFRSRSLLLLASVWSQSILSDFYLNPLNNSVDYWFPILSLSLRISSICYMEFSLYPSVCHVTPKIMLCTCGTHDNNFNDYKTGTYSYLNPGITLPYKRYNRYPYRFIDHIPE
eukprot:SAG11_NODE_14501_length_609_cov_5.466667_1_plen_145_part_01